MYKKISLVNTLAIGLMIVLNSLFCVNASAQQDTIYSQHFDATAFDSIPTGWMRTSGNAYNGWYVDNASNPSSGYAGASGGGHVIIRNDTGTATYTLTTSSIATTNYDSIIIIWGARYSTHWADSGSYLKFAWSANNGATWDTVAFTEHSDSSYWKLDTINIPAPAWNQANIIFRWTAYVHYAGGSGTYSIDDFDVLGVHTTGIKEINGNKPSPILFMQANNLLNIRMNNFSNGKIAVKVTNLDGSLVYNSIIESMDQTFSMNKLAAGVYIISMIANEGTYNQKLIINH